jgi:tetratricopeptide (TPR) repeat protein
MRKQIHLALAITMVLSCPLGGKATSPLDGGIQEYNKGHYREAIGLLGAAEKTEFNNPVLHYYLAISLAKLNEKESAIQQYKMALDLDPPEQLAAYCHAALSAYGVEKAAPTSPVFSPRSNATSPAVPETISPRRVVSIIGVFCHCPLCYRLQKIVAEMQREFHGNLIVTEIDKDDKDRHSQELIQQYNRGCPTLVILDEGGQTIQFADGATSEATIERAIQQGLRSGSNQDNRQYVNPAIMEEAQTKVREQETLLQIEIQKVNDDTNHQIADLKQANKQYENRVAEPFTGGYNQFQQLEDDMQAQIAQIKQDGQDRIDKLKKVFDAKKKALLDDAQRRTDGQPVR